MNKVLQEFTKLGNFLKLSTRISSFHCSAPSSNKLKFLGSKFRQKLISHIAIIPENNLDMFGAVIKSPFFPKGFF